MTGLSSDDRHRLDELFERAADLPADEHQAFLERECGANAALRRALERLLSGLVGEDRLQRIQNAGTLTAGTHIGPYRICHKIGEGGMGEVYLAEQHAPLERRVALKVIKVGMDTRQVIARFDGERQALARMDHPGIAKVFDAGSTDSGRPFFVMEYIEGAPILDYCGEHKLATRARLALFVDVCRAIQHAHQKGVIHRDIKPSNVLVTMHDGRPVPKVIDFGVAKATDRELTAKTMLTERQQMIGTPMYMSPEQADAGRLDIDTRSDIYSLGVLLYELLTGTTPFDVQDLLDRGFVEMMRVIREETPHKPSTRISTLGETATDVAGHRSAGVRQLGLELRGDLDWIVMRCLEKDRSRRYETASSLAADVERHLADEPVVAGPPSAGYRLRKFVRRHRVGVVAASLIAAVLLLGAAGTTWGLLWALDEKQRADAETARLQQVADFHASQFDGLDVESMGIRLRQALIAAVPGDERETVARVLADISFTELAKGRLEEDLFRPTIAAIDAQFADQPLVQAQLLQAIGFASFNVGLFELATDPAQRVLKIRRTELGENHADTALAHSNLGALLEQKGRFVEAEAELRKAFEGFRSLLGEKHPTTLVTLRKLGRVLMQCGDSTAALDSLHEALAGQQQVLGDGDSETLSTKNDIANLYLAQDDPERAENLLREVLDGQRRAHGDGDRRTLLALNNLGGALHMQRKLPEALELYKVALEGERDRVGDRHRRTLTTMTNVAGVLLEQGRVRRAGRMYRDALEVQQRVLGKHHPDTIVTLSQLGAVYARLGEAGKPELLDEALKYAEAAHASATLTLGPEHCETLRYLDNVGVVLQQRQDYPAAEAKFLEVIAAGRRVLEPDDAEMIRVLHNLAFVLQAQGRCAEATTHYEDALERSRRSPGPDHPNTWIIGMNLGRNYAELARFAEAIPLLEAAYRRAEHPMLRAAAWHLFDACIAAGEHARALELLPEVRASLATNLPALTRRLTQLGALLLRAERWSEAEAVLTECTEKPPTDWTTFHAKSLLGAALLGQKKFADAEAPLTEGYRGLRAREAAMPNGGETRVAKALERLVALYDDWQRAEPGATRAAKLGEWKAKLKAAGSETGK